MTHRIDLRIGEQGTMVLFQGLLDRPALLELAARCRVLSEGGTRVLVILSAGTRVEAGLVEELVRLEGITLEAESPFLARWIQSCLNPKAPGQ